MGIKFENKINVADRYSNNKTANGLILVIFIANMIRNLGSSIVDIGLPKFILNLSGTLTSYGLVIGIFSVMQSLLQFPMATISDKYGRKRIILFGMSLYILGTFLCFIAQNIFELLIFRAIQGAGAYSSILQAIISDAYRKEKQGKAMSYYSFSLTLGYFGGIVVGGYISTYLGFRMIFLISGILATFSAILILLFLKETIKARVNKKTKMKKRAPLKNSKIFSLLKEPQYGFVVALNSIRWFIFGGIVSYLIWVLQIHFNLTRIQTSYLLLVVVAVYVVTILISGRLVDQNGPKKLMLIAQAIIILFGFVFIIVSITNNFLLFLIASICSGIGFAILQTAGNTFLLHIVGEINSELKGTGLGFNNAIGFFCGAIGPVLLSIIGEYSLFLPYYLITILVFIAFIITLRFLNIDKLKIKN